VSATLYGLHDWKLKRDDDGHRDYELEWFIGTNTRADGPQVVLNCPGLPALGTAYNLGNDADAWAFAYPGATVHRTKKQPSSGRHWILTQKFSTKPLNRCQTAAIEDPLLEPPKIGYAFNGETKEFTHDRHGNPILNSAMQQVRGKAVEGDDDKITVWIEQNLLTIDNAQLKDFRGALNDSALWGLAAREVRLFRAQIDKLYYGVCTSYYRRRLEFEIGDFDRRIIDRGTMRLKTGGDAADPRDYERAKDSNGENVEMILNLAGQAWDGVSPEDPSFEVEFYGERNLALLGIPVTL
jgi:hypothetical protein